MNVGDPVATPPSLVDRVKSILLTPKLEWPKIEAEPATIGSIYTSYVLPIAAIPAVAGLIGALAFGYSFFGVTYRPLIGSALSMAITQYALALIGVFVLSLIIDWLAPTFGGVKNQVNAFKVAAYSATAAWVAGILSIIPSLAMLGGLLGLYSLYLLYLGLPLLMKAPADKAMSYTVVTIIAAFVLAVVIGMLVAPISGMFGGRMGPAPSEISGTLNVPGAGSVDLGKLESAAKQMEASAKNMEAAATTGQAAVGSVAPSALQGLLPDNIGSYHRTSIESASMGAAGIGGSHANARYEAGENNFELSVTDMAAAGALAAMGAAMNVQSNSQTERGYEKTNTIDGRLVTEKWNKDGNGEFGMLVKNRFMVQAEGKVASIDELKSAVASVGIGRLEAMAN